MPSYGPPLCLRCQLFKSGPNSIGDSGHCLKYKKIPVKIFYESGNCSYFKEKGKK